MNDIDKAYAAIGYAVLRRTAKDYRLAVKHLRNNPDDEEAKRELKEAIEFFMSDWCMELSGGVNGIVILRHANELIINERRV